MTDAANAKEKQDGFRAWYLLALLSVAFILSMVDRTILVLVVEPIKADLNLSDTGIALLQGASFALLYAAAGIPFGLLADKINRRNLIAGGIAFWSAMTAMCGFAGSYAGLFAARAGVAVGEATLSPAAYSMLADRFSKARLGRAIGIYTAAGVLGTGIALLLGSAVLDAVTKMGGLNLGSWGSLRPWQATFLIVGLPGLVVALLVATTVREPKRIARENAGSEQTLREILRAQPVVYGGLLSGYAAITLFGYAFLSWAPTALIRVYDATPVEVGYKFGMVMLVFGGSGPVIGGWASDFLKRRGHRHASFMCLVAASILAFGFALLSATSSSMTATLSFYCGAAFAFSICLATLPLTMQLITPAECRGRIAALSIVVANVIGIGGGPLLVGLLNDHIFTQPNGIASSLPLVLATSAAIAGILFEIARRAFDRADRTS